MLYVYDIVENNITPERIKSHDNPKSKAMCHFMRKKRIEAKNEGGFGLTMMWR